MTLIWCQLLVETIDICMWALSDSNSLTEMWSKSPVTQIRQNSMTANESVSHMSSSLTSLLQFICLHNHIKCLTKENLIELAFLVHTWSITVTLIIISVLESCKKNLNADNSHTCLNHKMQIITAVWVQKNLRYFYLSEWNIFISDDHYLLEI